MTRTWPVPFLLALATCTSPTGLRGAVDDVCDCRCEDDSDPAACARACEDDIDAPAGCSSGCRAAADREACERECEEFVDCVEAAGDCGETLGCGAVPTERPGLGPGGADEGEGEEGEGEEGEGEEGEGEEGEEGEGEEGEGENGAARARGAARACECGVCAEREFRDKLGCRSAGQCQAGCVELFERLGDALDPIGPCLEEVGRLESCEDVRAVLETGACTPPPGVVEPEDLFEICGGGGGEGESESEGEGEGESCEECAFGACGGPLTECFTGSCDGAGATCGEIIECVQECDQADCFEACRDIGCESARRQWDEAFDCILDRCQRQCAGP